MMHRSYTPTLVLIPLTLSLTLARSAIAQQIVGVSIPVDSCDAECYPLDDNIWSVNTPPFPLNITQGIGYLVNPSFSLGESFTLHDHHPIAPNIPDPARSVITYQFDVPTIVRGVEIVQHTNGITQVEGFSGSTLPSLASLGSFFGPAGDITGAFAFAEGEHHVFDFGNTSDSGTLFQLIIRKNSLTFDAAGKGGFATYRIYPLDVNGNRIPPAVAPNDVPEPGTLSLVGSISSFGVALWLKRRNANR